MNSLIPMWENPWDCTSLHTLLPRQFTPHSQKRDFNNDNHRDKYEDRRSCPHYRLFNYTGFRKRRGLFLPHPVQ